LKFLLVVCSIGLLTLPAAGQFSTFFSTDASIALGAYSRQSSNCFSLSGNQAALSKASFISWGIRQEKRFNLSDNSLLEARIVIPMDWGNVGCKFSYNGFAGYRQMQIGLAYGRKLSEVVSIGVQGNYYKISIPGYVQMSTFNVEGGVLLQISSTLTVGWHINNPVKWMAAFTTKEQLPYAYRMGIGYDASKEFFLCLQWQKEESKPIQLCAALEYHYAQSFYTKLGVLGGTETIFAGLGVCFKGIRLDFLINHHLQLGFSPGILLSNQFKSRKPFKA